MFRVGKHTNMSRKLFWTDEHGVKQVCYLVFVVDPNRYISAEIDDPLCALEGDFRDLANWVAERITLKKRRLREDQMFRNLTMGERARFVANGQRKRYAQSWYKLTPQGLVDVRFRCERGMWHVEPVSKRALELFKDAHEKLPPEDDIPEVVRPAQVFRVLRRLRRDGMNCDASALAGPECERLRQEEAADWARIEAYHEAHGLPAP